METQQKVYGDSRLFQRDFAQVKVEILIDQIQDLLPDVELLAQEKKISKNATQLVDYYMNLYNRTKTIIEGSRDYMLTYRESKDPLILVKKVKGYIELLLEKGFSRLGQEEVQLR
jgi:hypothetical protein